ncbi:hypothetical protein CI109_101114 [Kwoniella shandongensis]|uniref:Uncharacterized protein n=1 Tax=Kwoniella shandongensis TaxID=1734106 RepID=A0A5M6C4Z3_9TREE|nr:uncharacterized protein CI109_001584 [Kwoniella shandongensis]KAA5530178.1 hypothetical protein CI109_001584 [Kwoniella shandongensis]
MTSAAPRNALPRSPAGNFLSGAIGGGSQPQQQQGTGPGLNGLGTSVGGGGSGQSEDMARSPSAISSVSSSSFPRPGLQRRRSTDTSGGLDYYWSSLAGVGASSSSSSLAVSPSPSSGLAFSVSPSPAPSLKGFELRAAKSYGNLTGGSNHSQLSPTQTEFPPYPFPPPQPQPQQHQSSERTPRLPQMDDSDPTPTTATQRLHIPQNPNATGPPSQEGKSPGGWSESSKYSTHNSNTAPNSAVDTYPSGRPYPMDRNDSTSSGSNDSGYASSDYRAQLHFGELDLEVEVSETEGAAGAGDLRKQLLDPSLQPNWEVRSSVNSTSTVTPDLNSGETEREPNDETLHRTPMAPAFQERPDLKPPQLFFSQDMQQRTSPSGSGAGSARATPTQISDVSPRNYYTPSTAHQLNFAEPPASAARHETPNSAPAWKSEFGEINKDDRGEEEDEDTLKGRNDRRSTLPATTSTSSGAIVEAMLSPSQDDLLSPDTYVRSGTPNSGKGNARRDPSPKKSPEPPPKSTRRAPFVASAMEIDRSAASSPASIQQTLPVITHTPNSPMPSPDRSRAQPHRPDRSPDRQHTPTFTSPSFPSSASIADLTDMLGGAIDAIGLIDSRDTPPPTIAEPSKREKPNMSIKLGSLQPAAELNDRGPITPTSLPMRGASLPGTAAYPTSSATAPVQAQSQTQAQGYGNGRSTTQPELNHKTSSLFSKESSSQAQSYSPPTTTTTIMSITARPWPAAMLYGNIKGLRTSGDRARGYARAINELARSESGLREWCAASVAQAHRPVARIPGKKGGATSLGVRGNGVPSAIPLPHQQLSPYDPTPHQRNVSAGSEFPMRADSYTAREISQRIIDPADQPTALPANLPYPQLQAQLNYSYSGSGSSSGGGGGGLKPSQSMQSVASFASSKKGFFSAIGRRGSGKKESLSLGPPGGGGYSGGGGNKKDVRGLPISGPRSTSPHSPGLIQVSAPTTAVPRNNSTMPMGPRGPRPSGGSYTPPPQSLTSGSFQGAELISGGRASLDTGLARMTQGAPLRGGNTRDSMDSTRTVPAPNMSSGVGLRTSTPREEEELRHIGDILPHAERSVLRVYLRRYGDPMQAIGAYLEDEKNGNVSR